MNTTSRLLALLAVTWLAACTSTPPVSATATPEAPPTVLLISLDGVHPDDLTRGDTPHLAALAREGVQAAWMTPSYPSLTFPNHYTLVTGLRPDRHGLVHNSMQTPALGQFRLSNREAVGDGRWWEATPIWVTAERAGLPTATLFWPGSEAPIDGVRPTRWTPFDAAMPKQARVDQVLAWLSEPATTRPRLVTLYFEHPDSAAHANGPGSAPLRAALQAVDTQIGRLVAGIAAADLSVDLVVVSDHGMAEVPDGQVIAVEAMVPIADAQAVSVGQVIGFIPTPGREQAVEAALLGPHAQYDCWRREQLPARWHYGRHPRVPPIICQMHVGWDALPREVIARRAPGTRGSHGYDPALPQMRAVFIANGPSFQRGLALPAIDNVDVYPLLTRLLGLAPAEHDGNPDALTPALRAPSQHQRAPAD